MVKDSMGVKRGVRTTKNKDFRRWLSETDYGKWLAETPHFPGLFEEIHAVLLAETLRDPEDRSSAWDPATGPAWMAARLTERERASGVQENLL